MASKSELKFDTIGGGKLLDKASVLRSLDELRGFQANWDGYGAAPLDPRNLEAAQSFIESLPDGAMPTPKVVPMTRGRVQNWSGIAVTALSSWNLKHQAPFTFSNGTPTKALKPKISSRLCKPMC